MAAPESPLPARIAAVPTGHTVAEALDEYWRSKGMLPPSREELADLPPWPEEDAAAFERHIHEMFERIDEHETIVPPITLKQLEAFFANCRTNKNP